MVWFVMEDIRVLDKVKISCPKCCLIPSPSNYTLVDIVLFECDAASLGI